MVCMLGAVMALPRPFPRRHLHAAVHQLIGNVILYKIEGLRHIFGVAVVFVHIAGRGFIRPLGHCRGQGAHKQGHGQQVAQKLFEFPHAFSLLHRFSAPAFPLCETGGFSGVAGETERGPFHRAAVRGALYTDTTLFRTKNQWGPARRPKNFRGFENTLLLQSAHPPRREAKNAPRL